MKLKRFTSLGKINLFNEFHANLRFTLLDFVCKVGILADGDDGSSRGKVRTSCFVLEQVENIL